MREAESKTKLKPTENCFEELSGVDLEESCFELKRETQSSPFFPQLWWKANNEKPFIMLHIVSKYS